MTLSPSHRAFSCSPIIATVPASDIHFPAGSKMRLVNITVNSDTLVTPCEFHAEFDGADVICNISSAARAALFHADYSSFINGKDDFSSLRTNLSVTYHLSYMSDGRFVQTTKSEASAISVFVGGFSEMERYLGRDLSQPFFLTHKPNLETVSPDHEFLITYFDKNFYHRLLREQAMTGAFSIQPSSDFYREAYGDSSVPRTRFLFVNSFGVIEDASAVNLELLQSESAKQRYSRVQSPAFVPIPNQFSRSITPSSRFLMSSGACTADWAAWWANEFLCSDRHWMLLDGQWIPVTVTAKSSQQTIYNRAATTPSSIDFEVAPSFRGVLWSL